MDLNGLISTITTSTAALVAIIGGFLVSRVISLASDQNGIKRRIREIKKDLDAKREMLENAERFLFEDDLNDFVSNDNIKLIILGRTLEEVIEEDEYDLLTEEEVEPYYKQVKQIALEIAELQNSTDEYYDKFSKFKEAFKDFKYPDRMNWYEKVFKVMDDMAQPESNFPLGGFKFRPAVPNINTDYKDTRKEQDRLNDDIRVLELQLAEQLKILNDYGKPKWVWSGMFVLIYSCGVGIVYPSTLLPYSTDTYDDVLTKWFLLGLFFSQLVALFVYLGFAMYKLTNDKDES
ncbi:hypothetical protein [Cytobacillus horneckiae]|uniref:Uncharacterized protein n=1 Tax=Cytobacillus horneckiae TaxID=549687 RepID=A0A2N0ZMD8_9BACI|nr:hypothetical protein [Cytobacillus horneckiae]MEC1155033.1 hypothetical protein [Cytobacillus horneckiae]MED2936061.1 hypothetical protein [Cytobacillus horneckiae]PKG30665.1 hypothetical protein CWS20_01900 [Cytobacillus horneckiae]